MTNISNMFFFGLMLEIGNSSTFQKQFSEGATWASVPLFCNDLFFCDSFERLRTVLIAVKLIIVNAPLIYIYPNTIKTYLTPNHLLFDR